jgi:hypothetical protein
MSATIEREVCETDKGKTEDEEREGKITGREDQQKESKM